MTSVGTYLRDLRERRGVPLAEIARTTRVAQRYLESLEADDHGKLPAAVFTRGYVRAYCQALGEAPDEALACYDGREGHAPPPPARPALVPRAGESRSRSAIFASLVLLVVLGMALFTVALVIQPRERAERRAGDPRRETPPTAAPTTPGPAVPPRVAAAPSPPPVGGAPSVPARPGVTTPPPPSAGATPAPQTPRAITPPPTSAPALAPSPAVTPAQGSAPRPLPGLSQPPAPAAVATPAPAPAPRPATTPPQAETPAAVTPRPAPATPAMTPASPAAAEPGAAGPRPLAGMPSLESVAGGVVSPYRLVARTNEATWIRVRTEDGRSSEENVPAGEVREWVSDRPFVVTVGNAGGVSLELNGRTLPPLGGRGAVIPRLVLPPDNR
jgi:cytoskeleton protein RodZ